uniref:CSON011803 protein n=1 Tax=Culicoides sonorensis TaxID=179676 RepID=A0A336M7Z2_CULSO
MLKHVQVSPIRSRADSLSIRSSTSCASSLCGSPEPGSEPTESLRSHSRASSYSSLSEAAPQTTLKIYTACLRQDIEYKTLGVSWDTTSREVVQQVLRRCKMKHRDPRLFYLSMEITVRRPAVKTLLILDDNARPALLQACHPKGDSRFCLKMKPGGLIRVHTSVLQPNSQYKSLLISEETSSDELLSLLLSCYNLLEPVEYYSLYEVCTGQEYQRKLHPDDLPLRAQTLRQQRGEVCHFLVRKNPNYPRQHIRKQLLLTPVNTENSHDNNNTLTKSDKSSACVTCVVQKTNDHLTTDDNQNEFKDNNNDQQQHTLTKSSAESIRKSFLRQFFCNKCQNSITNNKNHQNKITNCDFCNNSANKNNGTVVYSPVYNIREIRPVSHTFSSLGIDKKLIDIESTTPSRHGSSQSINSSSLGQQNQKKNNNQNKPNTNKNCTIFSSNQSNENPTQQHSKEQVNTNPSKGFGNFVYI